MELRKKVGGFLMIKVGAILLLIAEIIFLVSETKGDLANGILFFLEPQLNFYFLTFLVLYFGTLYFLGYVANRLLIKYGAKRNLLTIVFATISALLLTLYFQSYVHFYNDSNDPAFNLENEGTMIRVTIQNFIMISIFMIFSWIWATRRMLRKT